jgi:hypothetical protein
MMHEMTLVSGVIVLTLLVMAGLLVVFRKWLARRDDLVNRAWGTKEGVATGSQERLGTGEPSGRRAASRVGTSNMMA